MRIEKWSGNVTVRSLSPGERAGVRASVNIHSIENRRGSINLRLKFSSSSSLGAAECNGDGSSSKNHG
jgi:hypothetical protein